ncbi:hypothetical protein E2C01_060232 [Portunus trituberculatus]|uniref:Uncharacterized protein n=1 Tax=Portunus trituberculatus TaxID=210409 RepID=A0A5B7H8B4_PORTR|nr:hypothetical protein [Portunus trituberculatus]
MAVYPSPHRRAVRGPPLGGAALWSHSAAEGRRVKVREKALQVPESVSSHKASSSSRNETRGEAR